MRQLPDASPLYKSNWPITVPLLWSTCMFVNVYQRNTTSCSVFPRFPRCRRGEERDFSRKTAQLVRAVCNLVPSGRGTREFPPAASEGERMKEGEEETVTEWGTALARDAELGVVAERDGGVKKFVGENGGGGEGLKGCGGVGGGGECRKTVVPASTVLSVVFRIVTLQDYRRAHHCGPQGRTIIVTCVDGNQLFCITNVWQVTFPTLPLSPIKLFDQLCLKLGHTHTDTK